MAPKLAVRVVIAFSMFVIFLHIRVVSEVKTNGKSAQRFDRISLIIKLKSEDKHKEVKVCKVSFTNNKNHA